MVVMPGGIMRRKRVGWNGQDFCRNAGGLVEVMGGLVEGDEVGFMLIQAEKDDGLVRD